ncbi:MAG: chloride channel protein [Lachnospiraceae bacterium]|nr:chloride channel protein [Lachnospiraceae bacterium]
MDKKWLKHKLKHNGNRAWFTLRWVFFSVVTGALLGVLGGAFYHCIRLATSYRLTHDTVLLALPIGAVILLWLYKVCGDEGDKGTNLVLSAIHSDASIPLRMAPLIFISTVFSHFVGASVGREGAALQLGGSLGENIGKLFHISSKGKSTMIMVGMAASFSALFGTPMAAAVFALEVVVVGQINYNAFLPTVLASFTARAVALMLKAPSQHYDIGALPAFRIQSALWIALLATLCGLVSMLFCLSLHLGEGLGKKYFKNPYIRAMVCGGCVLLLTFLIGDQTYNGAGVDYIIACLNKEEKTFGFLWKILFTVLSITAGYKGGEIVPSFFIGASFGCLFGNLTGFSPALCAAIGMGAIFCGVTNAPLSAFIICIELFGFSIAPYALLACAISYTVSGYYGLYTSQRILYSKYRSEYINKNTQ